MTLTHYPDATDHDIFQSKLTHSKIIAESDTPVINDKFKISFRLTFHDTNIEDKIHNILTLSNKDATEYYGASHFEF